jgi:hypothetical protein
LQYVTDYANETMRALQLYPDMRELKVFDTEEGLLTLFKPYQAALMEHIWELNKDNRVGITSGQAYKFLQSHQDKKSRASVIFFNDMVEEDILTYEKQSGKRG